MPSPGAPKDALGNELHVGDLVILHMERNLICQIKEVQNGGIMTPQGPTTAAVRVYVDITLRALPGQSIHTLARVVSPGNDKVIDDILGKLKRKIPTES